MFLVHNPGIAYVLAEDVDESRKNDLVLALVVAMES